MTGREVYSYAPWIDYCLPAYAQAPEPRPETDPVRLFGLEGWVAASSAPPSDYDAQQDAVGMVFHCRPRGGYGHSFRSENAFDIHAYGETVSSGGGTTSNQEFFANHTMSHNTLWSAGGSRRRRIAGTSRRWGGSRVSRAVMATSTGRATPPAHTLTSRGWSDSSGTCSSWMMRTS
jgi:hypothetical protein